MRIISGSNTYTLHPSGEISRPGIVAPSHQWRLAGAVRFNNFGRTVERKTAAEVLAGEVTNWQYKNGTQRWHIIDVDHGTTRVWMNPTHRVTN